MRKKEFMTRYKLTSEVTDQLEADGYIRLDPALEAASPAVPPNGPIPSLTDVGQSILHMTDYQVHRYLLREILILRARLDHIDSLYTRFKLPMESL